jgi:hypothetical protein
MDASCRRGKPQWPQWVVDGQVRPDAVVGMQEGGIYIGRVDKRAVVWWNEERDMWVEEDLAGKTESEGGRWEKVQWAVINEDGPYHKS